MKTALAILFLLLASACAPPPHLRVEGCAFFGYIYPSQQDTEETQRQILNHNIAYQKLCEVRHDAP